MFGTHGILINCTLFNLWCLSVPPEEVVDVLKLLDSFYLFPSNPLDLLALPLLLLSLRPGLLTPPLFLLYPLSLGLLGLPLDPLLFLPLPLFLLDPLLVLPLYPQLLSLRLPLQAEVLLPLLVLLLSLDLEDLLSLLLPGLSDLRPHTLVLRGDRLVDEEGRDVGEEDGDNG